MPCEKDQCVLYSGPRNGDLIIHIITQALCQIGPDVVRLTVLEIQKSALYSAHIPRVDFEEREED